MLTLFGCSTQRVREIHSFQHWAIEIILNRALMMIHNSIIELITYWLQQLLEKWYGKT
jgi:hypothetical protein